MARSRTSAPHTPLPLRSACTSSHIFWDGRQVYGRRVTTQLTARRQRHLQETWHVMLHKRRYFMVMVNCGELEFQAQDLELGIDSLLV